LYTLSLGVLSSVSWRPLFLATPESDQDEVQELYHRFLHRQADAAGLMVFENQLQHGVANEQVAAVLLGSDEYFQLAQQ
jgi:hypothetical protein